MSSKNQNNVAGCTSILVFLLAFWLSVGGGVLYLVNTINKISEMSHL